MKVTVERQHKLTQIDCDCVLIGYVDGQDGGGFFLSDDPVPDEDVEMCAEGARLAALSVIGNGVGR